MSIHRCFTGELPDELDCNQCGKTFPLGYAYTNGWVWVRYESHGEWLNMPFCSWACASHATRDAAETELLMAAR